MAIDMNWAPTQDSRNDRPKSNLGGLQCIDDIGPGRSSAENVEKVTKALTDAGIDLSDGGVRICESR